jgi:hypothetical protein
LEVIFEERHPMSLLKSVFNERISDREFETPGKHLASWTAYMCHYGNVTPEQ